MAALKLKTYSMEETANMEEHSTNYYYSSDLILRRGQTFAVTLTFNRPIQKADKIEFIAETGPSPQDYDNTLVVFELSSSGDGASWTAVADSSSSNDLNVVITSPADAVIGRYKLGVEISSKKKDAYYKLQEFILLFNPWATDDVVFMEDEDERQEYVLNDSGILYYGIVESINEDGWNYGQFEEGILDICLILLDMSLNHQEDPALDCSQRNDPIYVGRVVSAMINSSDDEGVLEGKWSGKLWGGVDPTNWRGSVEILKKWHRGGYKPVKYGQCWVFAGVMCTVLRCLGIPTRTITNFASAHDKDANLTVDSIYDSSGKSMSKDTMWNYHVWNESWFQRFDLGSAYDGWQVLDATPQEISEGLYCCGPASLHAIKEGDVDLNFDVLFIFSEVNADRATWIYYDKDIKERVYTDTKFVGRNISTKGVGSDERVDITDNYKYPEGSAKERAVYLKAHKKMLKMKSLSEENDERRGNGRRRHRKRDHDSEPSEEPAKLDITGKFEVVTPPKFGEDVNLILSLKNVGKKSQAVTVKISSSSIQYTGIPKAEVFKHSASLTVDPTKEKQIPLSISATQYQEKLTKDYLIEVAALCELKTGEKMLVRTVISLEKPPLLIKVLGNAVVDQPVELEVTFTNPLSVWLNDSFLVIEGSGLIKKVLMKKVPKLKPRGTGSIQLDITPYRSGTKQLQVDFTSIQFPAIKAFQSMEVAEE